MLRLLSATHHNPPAHLRLLILTSAALIQFLKVTGKEETRKPSVPSFPFPTGRHLLAVTQEVGGGKQDCRAGKLGWGADGSRLHADTQLVSNTRSAARRRLFSWLTKSNSLEEKA